MAGTSVSFLVFSGGNDRAVFGFLRALRLCGLRAHIVARTSGDRILLSSFKKDVRWVRPTHELTPEIFSECISRVRAQVGEESFVLLPSTEYLNTFFLRNRHAIEGMGCRVPLVDADLYMRLTGKLSAAEFFSNAGVPIPRELPVSNLIPPVVAKPIRNVSVIGQSLYPHLLKNQADLDAFFSCNDPADFFFQEYVQGDSLYLLFHLSGIEGRDVVWSQRNLFQQPGGKSMLFAEASSFHLSESAMRILGALRDARFFGLGMVEVIREKDRDVFIEMNPRIWGPVQLCIDQGQPLLQTFIGEALHGNPIHFADRMASLRRTHYLWLGGVLETMMSGQVPARHFTGDFNFLAAIKNLGCDVYLRKDSWRCFVSDLSKFLKWRITRERN